MINWGCSSRQKDLATLGMEILHLQFCSTFFITPVRQFINLYLFRLNKGTQIRFWKDKWLGHHAFKPHHANI
jgi:hypothetical protein